MQIQIYHLIAFLVAAVVVLWTIPDVRNIGIKSGQLDKPGERKVHQRAWEVSPSSQAQCYHS